MKKKVSLLLIVALLSSMIGLASLAEGASWEANVIESVSNVVAAEGDQVAIETRVKDIIEVDGLKFRDLNDNGSLDVYEDWRQNIDARVEDLLSQMTLDEKIATLMHNTTGGTFTSMYPYTQEWMWSNEEQIVINDTLYTPMYHSIVTDGVTTYLHNTNGTPKEQLEENNTLQMIAESGRLGIPVVLSCDRSYNTWAGMVDMSHYAFGTAHDAQLLYDLVSQYAKEEYALGYHVPFHTYGEEIGSWYGDEVNYIAEMTATEVKAYEENGVNACTKHFIARGGRNSYSNATSAADLSESWMVGWKAAVDAGTSWVMTNNGEGLTDGVNVPFDAVTLGYLRDTLGYEGIIVTDWPLFITSPSTTGITADGTDLSTLTPGELYVEMLEAGIDQFGGYIVLGGTDTTIMDATNTASTGTGRPSFTLTNWPDAIKAEVEAGKCDIELIDRSCRRVLKNKFELGLFEQPYRNWEDALEVFASDAYKAEQFELTTIEDIYAARKDETNAMEIALQTKSAVLLKNDGNLLPLSAGIKAYVAGSSEEIAAMDAAAIGQHATVVASMEEADVVIARVTALDDASELLIDDANAAGKPVVLVLEAENSNNELSGYEVEGCAAILMQTYRVTPDHGSSLGNFFLYTLPDVMADMLFGVREPEGSTVFEIARTADDATLAWGDLQLDQGVDLKTRLYMAATVKQNPTAKLPNNLGDVLYPNGFGMRYGQDAAITLETLVVPQTVGEVETTSMWGTSTSTAAVNATVKSGESFEVNLIAMNGGADGYTTVEAYEGDTLLASKFVSVEGGSFCIVTLDVTLEGAGEHTIAVGDMTATIAVE